jgi:hypothetical protein
MVVADRDKWQLSSRWQEITRLRCALPDVCQPIDLLLYTPSEVADWRGTKNHIIARAFSESQVLYERN